jgi:hypothetical protein
MDQLFLLKVKLLEQLLLGRWHIGCSCVYLVDYGDNDQVGVESFIKVADRLGLNPFSAVDYKNGAFARSD